MSPRRSALAFICFLLLSGTPLLGTPGETPQPASSGVFSEEQAARGEVLYGSRCASCHGRKLVATYPDAPTLAAPAFGFGWHGKTIAERFERIRSTMPLGNAGSLSDQEYLDVLAYILKFNGYPSGDQDLTPDMERLEQIVIDQASAP